MEQLLSSEVKDIFKILQENGHQVYLVGGVVRDYFLNRENNDFDIATSATPSQMISLLKRFKLNTKNSNFGNIRIRIPDKNDVEITTFRTEKYGYDTRYPTEIHFVDDILIDLQRRDFTVNALAWNESGFVDCFDGLDDIRKSCIRAIGVPHIKFLEDPLRILRAVRFASQLNFTIEENTFRAIVENSHLILKLSVDSVRNEFIKILTSDNSCAIKLLLNSKILEYIFQDYSIDWQKIYFQVEENDMNIVFLLQELCRLPSNLETRLSAVLYYLFSCLLESTKETHICIEEVSRKILQRLNFPKRTISCVCNTVKYYPIETYFTSKININRLLYTSGKDCWQNIILIRQRYFAYLGEADVYSDILYEIKNLLEENKIISHKYLCITGNDMLELGYRGKEIGKIIDLLYDDVTEERIKNTRIALLERASNMLLIIKENEKKKTRY